jgi:hypothetical protein
MRDSYEDSPAGAREAGLRRLGRLTWRTTQLGALATVGFAIVFARTAPAPAASAQTTPTAGPAKATAAPGHAARHVQKPRRAAGTRSAAAPAGTQASQPAATRSAATQPAGQPAPQPATQPAVPSPTPTLAPPTTAPAPAPSTSSPVPTVTSTTHGGN